MVVFAKERNLEEEEEEEGGGGGRNTFGPIPKIFFKELDESSIFKSSAFMQAVPRGTQILLSAHDERVLKVLVPDFHDMMLPV